MVHIKGIQLSLISLSKDSDGNDKVEGTDALMSNLDKVLAKQSFNGYNDIKVPMSQDTITALNSFMSGLKKDVSNVLGLEC